ncbi:WxL domain-containing protein [Enterococcus rotai]|uniref:WxL domain-containing protein n=1 Tax=Enterococcus rotai TaxID=118060 RepID=UPI0032B59EE8
MIRLKSHFPIVLVIVACIASVCFEQQISYADTDTLEGSGAVTVTGSDRTNPIDPENPGTTVDPGESPYTTGPLRIDYVSALDFNKAIVKKKERTYEALAQQFFDETEPRGSYIQITDQRGSASGWTLQVKQNTQFHNTVIQNQEQQTLVGAYLSLDKGWANSSGNSLAPTVTRETIGLSAIDTAYEVATASPGTGRGVWTIAFGASEANSSQQPATLKPLKDKEGKAVIDEVYNKPAYTNSAVSLTVPESTKIYPVQYETEITWILAKLP